MPRSKWQGGWEAQDCVELYPDSYGKWNDEVCDKTAGYICKMPKSKSQGGQGWTISVKCPKVSHRKKMPKSKS